MNNWEDYSLKSNRGKYLIKFISEENLFRFLNSGKVWFSRVDEFGDKMECVTINDLKKENFPFNELAGRKRKYIISCWHNVGRESIAMWDTSYPAPEKRRVYALKFSTNQLIEYVKANNFEVATFERLYGNVAYKNLLRDITKLEGERMRRAAYRKEYSFKYEQEFRFVGRRKSFFEETGYGLKIGNPSNLDYEVMINPLLKKEEYSYYLNQLKQHPIGESKYKESELALWLKPLEW